MSRAPAGEVEIKPAEVTSAEFNGRNPHEEQMDDLFGDMRKQQSAEEEEEQRQNEDAARFAVKIPTGDSLHHAFFAICM